MKKHLLLWLLYLLPFALCAQVVDTTAQVAPQEQTIAYRYVNASSLTLRALPSASAVALAKIDGAGRVTVLAERPDGWSKVQVDTYLGFVKSEYLVAQQQDVTAETIDWSSVEASGGEAYAQVSAVDVRAPQVTLARPVVRKAAPKASAGPRVYICNNGRTEVYHSSEDCSAMRRCTYTTKVASTGEARGLGLRECMKCY
ncbi:SH3 domain-containing protein [Hymenobacter sp. HSC-4F20]|uniref:SH3 domain-containing protein n=1 Tax=Hymenobacter sp. HSC-4F20 TaxID=2864135 RepID=UPI001C72CD43|nr:SH3 domain-containing protein [Hymenobacter sp. HSC-4F20]MBX0293124.1 SH3 domain-containing protein [Hymenobacter sp. HSC-4F20]